MVCRIGLLCDVHVALREPDTALLVEGLRNLSERHRAVTAPGHGALGIQYLMWTTDSDPDLPRER